MRDLSRPTLALIRARLKEQCRSGTFFTLCSVLFAKQTTAYFPSGACLLDYLAAYLHACML